MVSGWVVESQKLLRVGLEFGRTGVGNDLSRYFQVSPPYGVVGVRFVTIKI